MKTRSVFFAAFVTALASRPLLGCATDGPSADAPVDTENQIPTVDSGTDAADAEDAGPCNDCEYFPETCSADVLCPNEPFLASGPFDSRTQVTSIRGRSANDLWVTGALGTLAHFDGTSFSRADVPAESLRDVLLRDDGEVTFVSLDRQFSRSQESWEAHPLPTAPSEYGMWRRILHSVWANPGSEWVWAATEKTACLAAACIVNPNSRTPGLWRLRLSPSDAPRIESGLSTELCTALSCGNMASIHGASANVFWAVGDGGAAMRISDPDSATPAIRAFNTQTWGALHGVWAASDSDVWAVGANGVVRHYTGHPVTWDIVDVPTAEDLNAVWGSSPSDVWAVGNGATVLHYDGQAWTRVKIAGLGQRRPKLNAVWVSEPGHVWIGGQGVVISLGGKP